MRNKGKCKETGKPAKGRRICRFVYALFDDFRSIFSARSHKTRGCKIDGTCVETGCKIVWKLAGKFMQHKGSEGTLGKGMDGKYMNCWKVPEKCTGGTHEKGNPKPCVDLSWTILGQLMEKSMDGQLLEHG